VRANTGAHAYIGWLRVRVLACRFLPGSSRILMFVP